MYGTGKFYIVERFRYPNRILSYNNTDIPETRRNLKKAKSTWGRVSKILTRQEVPTPVFGMFYQVVVAVVLLYRNKSWNLPPSGMKVLERFHMEAVWWLIDIHPQ